MNEFLLVHGAEDRSLEALMIRLEQDPTLPGYVLGGVDIVTWERW